MSQNTSRKHICLLALLSLLIFPETKLAGQLILEKDSYRIVSSEKEEGPLKLALNALEKDLASIFSSNPPVADKLNRDKSETEIVIVNMASGHMKVPGSQLKELDGFESHRIYTDPENNRIYLLGNDLRGTIFAIYTFAEEVLGVPPLKYWCSWQPELKDKISLGSDLDIFYHTPQVRYRTLLPGDQDFFTPWKRNSEENNNIWLETALRLKINTVETYSTILPDYKMTDYAYLIDRYGLVNTSHHTSGLNTSFRTWDAYWREMRKMETPEYLLANEQDILDFFTYNAETVKRSGIDNLWTVAFRGEVDQPYWSIFKDAPEDEKERADVINRMHQIQYDLIKEKTGEEEPYARITLYDELAILMARGYLKPPVSKNMILTFVAGRRDHYPFDDIVNFNASKEMKLGYYMNFGFASTGAHVAPAESPWKMEFNYRYLNSKAPLYFSVVNVGNFREFVLELSANSKLLWDYDSYDTDQFMIDYCMQYFGEEYATDVAALYKDFYNAYWIPKESEFEGLERQFVFQDLRYARVFDHVFEKFIEPQPVPDLNPLHKIGYESVPGRTFRIDPEFNNADNQVDAMLNAMKLTIPRFESVALQCSEMMLKLEDDKKTFFNDNLRVYSYYMTHLSKTLYHYIYAYKHQNDKQVLIKNLDLAHIEITRAQQYLFEAQHGVFSSWYSNADPLKRTFQINRLKGYLTTLKEQASEKE